MADRAAIGNPSDHRTAIAQIRHPHQRTKWQRAVRSGRVDRVEPIAARRPPSDMVTAIPGGGAYFALADHLQRANVLVGRRKAGGVLARMPDMLRFGARDHLAVRPMLL